MFSWLESVFQWGNSNIGGPIIGYVHDFIRGVYGFIHTVFGNIGEAWKAIFQAAHDIWMQADKFGLETLASFARIFRVDLPHLLRWAEREFLRAFHYVDRVYQWAIREFDTVRHWVDKLITSLVRWVMLHIWDPLFKSIELAWRWIFHEGALLWHYITHPDKLIDLVWDSLLAKMEKEAWNAGRVLGKFLLALVLHNVKEFVLLIEDIITAVL